MNNMSLRLLLTIALFTATTCLPLFELEKAQIYGHSLQHAYGRGRSNRGHSINKNNQIRSNERYIGYRENCEPYPLGCTCVIGQTQNGLDVFQIVDDVHKCKCRAEETTNGCPPSLKKIMERNRKHGSEFVLLNFF